MIRGGMRGGMGGGGNMNQMMKQVKKMQEQMLKAQEELATKTVEGTVVTVVVNGQKSVLSVTIKPEAVDPDDVEMLQDLVLTAVNDALAKAEELANQDMGKFTGGMNIPGLF